MKKINNKMIWAIVFSAFAVLLKMGGSGAFILFAIPAVVFWILYAKAPKETSTETYSETVETADGRVVTKKVVKKKSSLFDDTEKFATDMDYRRKVIDKYQKQAENKYKSELASYKKKQSELVKARTQEIARQQNADWKKENSIQVNRAAGLLKIDGAEYLFSSIKGARINCITGSRLEETNHEEVEEKKQGSSTGAVVGGIVGFMGGGIVGAGIGSAIGSKFSTTTSKETNSDHRSQTIATCDYLGVSVDMDGFMLDIPVLKHGCDQSSDTFRDAMTKANKMIVTLKALATLPVSLDYSNMIENRPEVLAYDAQIEQATEDLNYFQEQSPVLCLPAKYQAVLDQENQ